MKRIIFATLLALCVLFLLPNRPSNAQQGEQKKAAPLRLEKLRDGTQLLRVWRLEGEDKYPQISVLRVSEATYLKFFQEPQGFLNFVNANKVFSIPVIVVGPWVSLSSFVPKNATTGWVVTCVHGKLSTIVCSALPELKQESPAPKEK